MNPEELDELLTKTTDRNREFARWMERLKRLPDDLWKFYNDTDDLLTFYFEEPPSCSPEAYASAYDNYCYIMSGVDLENEERAELSDIQYTFPVRLSFRAVRIPEGGKKILLEKFSFKGLTSFLYTDLYKGMAAGNIPRRCHNCGHYFLAVGGYDTVYCNRPSPGKTKRTCRQVGAHRPHWV